jgi:hypothetical protein
MQLKVKEKEKMKVPKNELISILKIKKKPTQKDDAPLAKILLKYKGELSSKLLWNYSELDIENFYMQLKIELEKILREHNLTNKGSNLMVESVKVPEKVEPSKSTDFKLFFYGGF